jgi:hypothetical protein
MDSVLTISSVLTGRDYRREAARTMDSLGLSGLSAQALRSVGA